jgi:hypothetical protein
MVYDTSSSAPVELEARHLVLTRPGEDGARSLLDLIILRNSGRVTRVAPDTLHSTWTVVLPHGTAGLKVRESDLSAEALRRTGDSLSVAAALAPGEKQLTLDYQVPAGRRQLELPLDRAGLPINVLVEEPKVRVSGAGIVPADSQMIQDRTFRRYTGPTKAPGTLRLSLPGSGVEPRWVLIALVTALALALAGGGWYALRQDRDLRQEG